MKNTEPSAQKRSTSIRRGVIAVLLLFLFLLLLYVGWRLLFPQPQTPPSGGVSQKDTSSVQADTVVSDSAASTDTLADTADTKDTVAVKPPPKRVVKPEAVKPPKKDTALTADTAAADTTIADTTDSLALQEQDDPCDEDTTSPWIYPEPAGGLHRQITDVSLVSSEKLDIQWRLGEHGQWRTYSGRPIRIDSSQTLFYRGKDSCGNEMAVRSEYYEIRISDVDGYCPEDMEYVEIGDSRFCIDRYEWPNRKGAVPQAYISIYHAKDSCFTVGKRLCTSEEWSMACAGAYGWKYPYGGDYEPRACNTTGDSARAAGSNPECRGYFNVYDMAGNLAEWTDTRARENTSFYNVMGGFWDSGSRSACFDSRYSYFPQNRHNPVGFRCCKDAAAEK
ncbi:MAG: formylglycine-generating enzyme family protein [Chitinivibrionales bacterium]